MAYQAPKQSLAKSEKDKRWEIINEIKKIQPEAGKNLKDLKIPETLYHLAGDVAKTEPVDERFKKVPVYELLVGHIRYNSSVGAIALRNAEPTLKGWKVASNALFRYALNLKLAPKRPEFKKMKVSCRSSGSSLLTAKVREALGSSWGIAVFFTAYHDIFFLYSSPALTMCTTYLATCTERRRYSMQWVTSQQIRKKGRARI